MSSKQTATAFLGKAPPLREDHHGVIPYTGNLRDIETTLLALIEVDPEELPPELRAEYERDLQEAIRKAPEKRERVAIKLFDLGQRAAVKLAAAEAHLAKARDLQASAARFERDADRLKNYVLDVMRELPKPKKGCRTLEGASATFKAKGVADSVEITDEAAIPDRFKTVTVTMPLSLYRKMLDVREPDPSGEGVIAPFIEPVPKFGRVSSFDIKAALQEKLACQGCAPKHEYPGCPVCGGEGCLPATLPGARLITGKLRLEVS